MDLLGGAYSDSEDDSDTTVAPVIAPREPSPAPEDSSDDDLDDLKKDESDGEGKIPLPDLELDSSGIGKSTAKIDPKVIQNFINCHFSTPFHETDPIFN